MRHLVGHDMREGMANLRTSVGFRGQLVMVDGVELSVRDHGGPGEPIVCLHAAGHGSRDFELLVARAGGRRRFVTVDWPAHGGSGPDRAPTDASRYADLLRGLLDALSLERVVLLGNSVGGAAALEVAAREPCRVSALVLVNCGGLAEPSAFVRLFTHMMAWIYRHPGARWFPWFFSIQYRILLRGPQAAEQRARIVAAGREHAGVLAELWRSFGHPPHDVRADISRVQCPVWLAWARHDPYNHRWLIRSALRRFHAPLTLYAGGHAPFLEQPDAFWQDLDRFLQAHACSASVFRDGHRKRDVRGVLHR
jgi:pimeloyl-ACP methyl ester carboxylesterase